MTYMVASFVMYFSEAVGSLCVWYIVCDCGDSKLFHPRLNLITVASDLRRCCAKLHAWWHHQMETFFGVTGHLCGEFTGPRWIPRTKASDGRLWCLLWSASFKRLSNQSWGWWFKTLLRPLWRHCNDKFHYTMTQYQDCFYWYNILWFIISLLSICYRIIWNQRNFKEKLLPFESVLCLLMA